MKYEIYECERCGKRFYIPEDESPMKLSVVFSGKKCNCDEEFVDFDLCPDCEASHAFFMDHYKEFDVLADKIARRETGEET